MATLISASSRRRPQPRSTPPATPNAPSNT
jgi:hypothetical protein